MNQCCCNWHYFWWGKDLELRSLHVSPGDGHVWQSVSHDQNQFPDIQNQVLLLQSSAFWQHSLGILKTQNWGICDHQRSFRSSHLAKHRRQEHLENLHWTLSLLLDFSLSKHYYRNSRKKTCSIPSQIHVGSFQGHTYTRMLAAKNPRTPRNGSWNQYHI